MLRLCVLLAVLAGADAFTSLSTGIFKQQRFTSLSMQLQHSKVPRFVTSHVRKNLKPATTQMTKSANIEESNIVEGPFEGRFGMWFVDVHDAQEVLTYRLSILASAISLASGLSLALATSLMGASFPDWSYDLCAIGFLTSFGVSLATIHIYMKPLHNMLKALWAGGATGSLAVLLSSPSHHLAVPTYQHPELLLASGWVFVALTGLFFKEFACFQRWEASALFALVPILTGGHFLHILPPGVEMASAAVLSVVYVFFASRKFSQPYKADIGDKTVFEFMAQQEQQGGGASQ